jgi:hypothetical protein
MATVTSQPLQLSTHPQHPHNMSTTHFQVRYQWTDKKGTHQAHTVVTAATQQEANATLQRLHPHITVINP